MYHWVSTLWSLFGGTLFGYFIFVWVLPAEVSTFCFGLYLQVGSLAFVFKPIFSDGSVLNGIAPG